MGTTASRGVAVLVRDRIHLSDLQEVHSQEGQGRLLRIDLSWEDRPITVVGVYAPSVAGERQDFFLTSLSPLLPFDRQVIVGGDFNCVAGDLDVTRNAQGRRRTGYAGGLQTVEDTFGLTDAWRVLHPSETVVTHTCTSHGSGARLDRWLTSAALQPLLSDSRLVEGLPGDHTAVALRITAVDRSSFGPGPWSFPLYLLDDPGYVAEAQESIGKLPPRPSDFRLVDPPAALGCAQAGAAGPQLSICPSGGQAPQGHPGTSRGGGSQGQAGVSL